MITRFFAAALTAVFLFAAFGMVTVYAGSDTYEPFIKSGTVEEIHPDPPPIIPEEAPPERESLTPTGTGTVVDNVTNENGVEFFTITSAAGNIFFLVIDRQRESENVYFLNAVTERDLMALAEKSDEDWIITSTPPPIIPETEPTPPVEAEPQPDSDPTPETESGGMGMIILIVVLALGGGAAGYYFKVYKPKQNTADDDFDYEEDYQEDADPYTEDTDDESTP